jgi:uncharacterized protein involved in exopolysaccharide biosynthesis
MLNSAIAVISLLVLLLIVEPYYESSIVILPEFGSKSTTLGGLSDLASLAGVNLGESTPTEIYENLLLSEAVLEPVILKKYRTMNFDNLVSLIQYFEIEADNNIEPEQAERNIFLKAYKNLVKGRIETSIERLTKILTVTVIMPESQLSAEVANAMVESLDNYIRYKRKTFASQQRFYIEKRIVQVKDSLTIAENHLRNFRSNNRIVEQSPALFLQQSRLMRNVEIQQAVFVELTKQLEIAKIDEIKETPVVNFRETAQEPVIKAGPPRALILAFIMFLSFSCTSAFYLLSDKMKGYVKLLKES